MPRIITVLPCYAVEDLAKNLQSDTAADYYAAWTALWHPALLPHYSGLPQWKRADASSLDVSDAIIWLPAASREVIEDTLRERLDLQDNVILESTGNRRSDLQILSTAVLQYESSAVDGATAPGGLEVDQPVIKAKPHAEVIAQHLPKIAGVDVTPRAFMALGAMYQQLHMLTRKVHYGTNLDLTIFHEQVLAAAEAFNRGDAEATWQWLQSCYDGLSQERDRYFSQAANLIDLVLINDAVASRLANDQVAAAWPHIPINIAAAGASLQKASAVAGPDSPEVSVGGFQRESPHAWLPSMTMLRDLFRSASRQYQLLHRSPAVFTRTAGWWTARDAVFVALSGMPAAVLMDWTGGRIAQQDKAKIIWQTVGTRGLDALAGFIRDATDPLAILSISADLAKQFDYHQSPTILLARWPGGNCEPLEDLRLASYCSGALGQWTGLEDYFESTGQPYSPTAIRPGQLPLPGSIDAAHRVEFEAALSGSAAVVTAAEELLETSLVLAELANWTRRTDLTALIAAAREEAASLLEDADEVSSRRMLFWTEPSRRAMSGWSESDVLTGGDWEKLRKEIDERAKELTTKLGRLLAAAMSGGSAASMSAVEIARLPRPADAAAIGMPWDLDVRPGQRLWLVNPTSAPRRVMLRLANCYPCCEEPGRVYAISDAVRRPTQGRLSRLFGGSSHARGGGVEAIVDIPANGVVALTIAVEPPAPESLGTQVAEYAPLAASPQMLSNEFLDVQLEPSTGQIRAILASRRRGTILSGQLSVLIDGEYAIPRARGMTIEDSTLMRVVVAARGDLMWRGERIGQFAVRYQLARGERTLGITPTVRLDGAVIADRQGAAAPVVVWRTAWNSEAATLSAWRQDAPLPLDTKRLEAVDLVEIDDAEHRSSIHSFGSSLHVRSDRRCLDTYLNGDSTQVVYGLDLPDPWAWRRQRQAPPWLITSAPALPAGQHATSLAATTSRGVWVRWFDGHLLPPPRIESASDADRQVDSAANQGDANLQASSTVVPAIGDQPARTAVEAAAAGEGVYLIVQETRGRGTSARITLFRPVAAVEKRDGAGRRIEKGTVVDGDAIVELSGGEIALVWIQWHS